MYRLETLTLPSPIGTGTRLGRGTRPRWLKPIVSPIRISAEDGQAGIRLTILAELLYGRLRSFTQTIERAGFSCRITAIIKERKCIEEQLRPEWHCWRWRRLQAGDSFLPARNRLRHHSTARLD